MNSNVQNALSELRRAGAQGLPDASKVEAAKDGMVWRGTKANGEKWELVKNSQDSYNCMC